MIPVAHISFNEGRTARVFGWLIILMFLALPALSILGVASAEDAISFRSIEFTPQCSALRIFDINGDGLSDIIGLQKNELTVFLQDKAIGFSGKASASYSLGKVPALVSPAKLGDKETLLVLDHEGLAAYEYAEASGAGALTSQSLIQCDTLLSQASSERNHVGFYPLTARTGKPYPLLLLPVKDGVEVWGHQDSGNWQCLQKLPEISEQVNTRANGSYLQSYHCNLRIWDLNHDGSDDLLFNNMRNDIFSLSSGQFRLYEQSAQGVFPVSPSQVVQSTAMLWGGSEGKDDDLQDINRDGRMDRVEVSWERNGSSLPGGRKIRVSVFEAAPDKSLPSKPQWVFRKNDGNSVCPVDIDGDGYLDFPLGYSRWKGREDLVQSFTTKKVEYNLRFHFYGDHGYSESPDCRKDLSLSFAEGNPLDAMMSFNGDLFERAVLFDGDFNGDGRRDLLARDEKDKVSIYYFRSRTEGFSTKADLQFQAGDSDELIVEDVNADGVSDLLVVPVEGKSFRGNISARRK